MADQKENNHTNERLPLKSCDHHVSNNNDATNVEGEAKVHPDVDQKKESFGWSKMNKRNRWTLVLVAMGMLFNGNIFYFMVPFYVKEGEKRGVSDTVIGIIFSTMHLTIFICSPFVGHFMPKIGAKFMYVSGAFVSGFCTMIFSLVELCRTPAAFIVTSMLCRTMTAVGSAAFNTAAFAIVANEFPDHAATVFVSHVGFSFSNSDYLQVCFGSSTFLLPCCAVTIFSITESMDGVGFMIGPVIGGSLYEAGGFIAPFLVVGGMMLCNGLQLLMLLPPPKAIPNTHNGSPFTLTKSLLFDIAVLNIFSGFLAIQFLDPTLSVRLQQFGLSPSLVGLGYLTLPCVYAIVSPLMGYLTDTKNIPTSLLLSGSFILGIAFMLVGPCPGLTFLPRDLWLVVLSTGLMGMAFCCSVAPTMKFMIMGAVEIGFPEHLDTYGLVSGTYYSMMCAGGVVGNFIGGALMDKFGFAFAAMVVGFILFGTFVITATYFVCRRMVKGRKEKEESSKLISNLEYTSGYNGDVIKN